MKQYYHYTLEKYLSSIQKDGIYPDHPYFTTTEYFSASKAGQMLGIMAHNIDCVLKFQDDGNFRSMQNVPGTGRFSGGGDQYRHPFRPKPIAIRKIDERDWVQL